MYIIPKQVYDLLMWQVFKKILKKSFLTYKIKGYRMDYIYIDESGDLGSDSNYFVMAAIIVDDKVKLDRIINKVRRTNKKELGKFNELKGTEAKPHIKKKVLKNLNKIDYQAIIIVFDKKNKYKIDYKRDNNLLYNILSSKLAEELFITNKTSIIIDKSKNKEKHRQEFDNLFLPSLNNSKNYPISIDHEDSVKHKGLQIVDVISWSVYKSFEDENEEFINLIKNISIKRVFED